jgi:hypothetical protein
LKTILFIGFSILLYLFVAFTGNFKDSVTFSGDEWEYQAIAVNQYYGHGFMVTGRLEETDNYKITLLDSNKMSFWESKSGKAFHRSPFYPGFLFIFYKLFGVHPLIVKLFQLLLIFIAGWLLIKIMEQVLGQRGFWVGLIAYLIFIVSTYRFAEHLMPENWQLLFISIITYLLFSHFRNKPVFSFLLGTVLAFSVLNKGTTFFLLPTILIYDIYLLVFQKTGRAINTLILLTSFALITGIWSFYLSGQINQPVFVTTQASEVLLDGNNEYCNDGLWHPEWRDNTQSYYYSPDLYNKPNVQKVLSFYFENPKYLRNVFSKLNAGFMSLFSFKVLLGIILTYMAVCFIERKNLKLNTGNFKIGAVFIFLALTSIIFYISQTDKYILSATVPILFVLSLLIDKGNSQNRVIVPVPFLIVFFNFLLFVLTFYSCNEVYISRYVKTMEGITILTFLLFSDKLYSCKVNTKK